MKKQYTGTWCDISHPGNRTSVNTKKKKETKKETRKKVSAMQKLNLMEVLKAQTRTLVYHPILCVICKSAIKESWRASAQLGGVRQPVVTMGGFRNIHGCVLYVFVRMCGREEQTAVVIAQEEPCAQRTLKLIKGRDRVIIQHGPLERLTLKSLLLINSEMVFAD